MKKDCAEEIKKRVRELESLVLGWIDEAVAEKAAGKPEPAPDPSYLDRLPEKLREFIVGSDYCCHRPFGCLADQEALARAIWESRDETFAAGEPTDTLDVRCEVFSEETATAHSGGGIEVHTKKPGDFIVPTRADSIRLARRVVAIALRKEDTK